MSKRLLAGICLALFAAVAALAATSAQANPRGLYVDSEGCVNGRVQALLHWTPDSAGQQFVDLSTKNDNFASSYTTSGPYPAGQSQELLTLLLPSTTYYLRVNTLIGTDFLRSQTLQYTTRSCGGSNTGSSGQVAPPTNLQAAAFSPTQARVQWVPGNGNRFFCVDFAKSLQDLFSISGSWRNSGCGTVGNSHVLEGLACGTTYYIRVWTSAGGGLYSPVRSVQTYSCASAISPPTGLNVIFTTKTTARLDWEPGKDNRWFCVDTATSQKDLTEFEGSWRNHSCWTSTSQVTIGGLSCGKLYFWRVYTWNFVANAHSSIASFRTDDCDTTLVQAPIEDVDVDRVGSEYHATITVGKPDACHSFGSYEADTFGNVIEITVFNSVTKGPCAQVYSTYTLTINLGSGFFPGNTYIVEVNEEESDSFTAK